MHKWRALETTAQKKIFVNLAEKRWRFISENCPHLEQNMKDKEWWVQWSGTIKKSAILTGAQNKHNISLILATFILDSINSF